MAERVEEHPGPLRARIEALVHVAADDHAGPLISGLRCLCLSVMTSPWAPDGPGWRRPLWDLEGPGGGSCSP